MNNARTMKTATFVLPGGVGFCNAVRRTLLSDVEAWAPCEVTVHENTSCQTDEFLAHRIGMIPFARVGNGEVLELDATGPCTACARDFTSPGFAPVHEGIELMTLGKDQRLRLTVRLDKQPAHKHARYAACAGVGMRKVDADRCAVSFSVNDGRAPLQVLLEALDHLDARVERALHALAHQPEVAPQGYT